MGLSKSKQKPRKGEEQKKGSTYSVPKSKEKLMEKHSQEGRQADRELEKPMDSLHLGSGTAKHLPPATSLEGRRRREGAKREKPDVKQKCSRKKVVVPQIIITRASNETLVSCSSSGSEQQRTIREPEDWGPYRRHRNPSTADAYNSHLKE
ncbi:spermatogenesis-associated protein 33 isoform X1 [Symphalangus syndactylus]|uniref:spermatogenesis-associated protein 33 isoform X1 n=1 Tax=Symphalangus syndactylus TaxID=9590 RepID=UPI0024431520|nr:spermatogenesis-associated protein 33 isoform X1 [Symphalangus syndactylus]